MDNRKILRKEYDFIFSKVPRLCVDIIVETNKGIILTKRAIEPNKGKWHLPGGRVFFKESLKDAAKRKAREELDIDIKIKEQLGTMEFHDEGEIFSVSVVFLAEALSEDIKIDDNAEEIIITSSLPEDMISQHKEFIESKTQTLKLRLK